MTDTKGRRLLNRWLKENGVTQQDFADMVGCKQPSVSAWCTGDSRPIGLLRTATCEIIGCEESDFDWPQDKRRRQALAKARSAA